MNFLFWIFLVGILIATFQDFKRREIDNWLNLFLLFSSFAYLLFLGNSTLIFVFALTLFLMYFVSHALYYGRVFAGGDAKLLFAITAFFVTNSLYETLGNIGIFLVLLMVSGAIYGLGYSFFIYFKNYKKVNKEFLKEFNNSLVKFSITLGVLTFILSYFYFIFLIPAFMLLFIPILFVFVKSLEKISLTKMVSGKSLREGDWLAKDITIGKKVFKYSFEGLSKKDLETLGRQKNVLIKDGMPFAFAFLLAFLAYVFFRTWLMGFMSFLF